MSLLDSPKTSSFEIHRIIQLLRTVIQESEKNGTAFIQPHYAILKGEIIDRILIINKTKKEPQILVFQALTNATMWQFIDKVSRVAGLAP